LIYLKCLIMIMDIWQNFVISFVMDGLTKALFDLRLLLKPKIGFRSYFDENFQLFSKNENC
jgi:hypothetical protein